MSGGKAAGGGIRWVYRALFYLIGQFLLAFGVAFSVNSNLGVSPTNSFPYAVSVVSGVSMGTCVTIVFCCYIVVQILLLRRNFKLKNLLQIAFSTIFGYFVDFTKMILGDFSIANMMGQNAVTTYIGQLIMLVISIFLVALGLVFYLGADIVPMPMEGMALAINQTLAKKMAFHNVKIIVDCISVGLATLVTLIGTGTITGVREGTIISALVIGKVMGLLNKPLRPKVRSICFGPEEHHLETPEQVHELEDEAETNA